MTVPQKTRWPIQPHTKIKHFILRKYLDAWLPIMGSWNGRIIFIDGFAGPGRYERGEEGSPLIALRSVAEHPHFRKRLEKREVVFLFIEREKDRADALEKEIVRFRRSIDVPAWVKIDVEQGEFDGLMNSLLDKLEREGWRLAPAFAFIDPFGFSGAPMRTIARIFGNPRCESLISFMYESVNRFLSHPEPAIQERLTELFGTEEWHKFIPEADPDCRRDLITDLYRRQLMNVAGVKYVRTFEMIDQGNTTEYFLFFCTNGKKGLSKMKQATWRADPASGAMFSDRTDPAQLTLLHTNPSLTPLRDLLRQQFRGRGWVPIETISDFTLEKTPFSEEMHLKTLTLKPMEMADPPLLEARREKGKRRKGTFPPGTKLRF